MSGIVNDKNKLSLLFFSYRQSLEGNRKAQEEKKRFFNQTKQTGLLLNIHLKSRITNRQRRKKVINVNDRNLNEARGSIHRHSIIFLKNARDVFS